MTLLQRAYHRFFDLMHCLLLGHDWLRFEYAGHVRYPARICACCKKARLGA